MSETEVARTLNEVAADWWAKRFGGDKDALRAALLKHLPDSDWQTYNDYDPEGPLLDALRDVQECRGFMFSGDGLFPRKTGLRREGKYLYAKEGYGASWQEVPRG